MGKTNRKADKAILLENAMDYLSNDEFMKLSERLSQNNIQLKFFESHSPKASLNDIGIFISANVTELMIAGILMPAVYDVIKLVLKVSVCRIKEKVKIVQSDKIREAVPCLVFVTKNGEIRAPIPSDLSEEQFGRYMDEIKGAIENIKYGPVIKHENFIIEQNKKSLKVEIKTMFEYAQEQLQKQHKKA